jgi:hypothetical protein
MASAANGRTHGLSASKLLREDEKERLAERTAELEAELKPEGSLQRDLVAEIAQAKVRIESCDMDEENWRYHRAQRAEYYWDEDCRAEVERLMSELSQDSGLIVGFLRQNLHGARRLRQAFAALAARVGVGPAGEPPRPLDEAGRARAFDLLGLHEEERQGVTVLDLPPGTTGDDAALAAHQAAVFAEQLADLERLTSERFVELDEKCRFEAELGNFYGIDEQTRLIRRYRSEAVRRCDKALKELRRLQEEAARRAEEEDDWEEDSYGSYADIRRMMPSWSTESAVAERTEARPTSQPRQGTAEKPVQAQAQATAGPADPTPTSAETLTNPPAEDRAPRPGSQDGSPIVRPGTATGPQPPRAESYVQKAAHRTCL